MSKTVSRLVLVLAVAAVASGCANTIRGAGADTANAVNATQAAGNNVATAVD